jgi:hypothetical protein
MAQKLRTWDDSICYSAAAAARLARLEDGGDGSDAGVGRRYDTGEVVGEARASARTELQRLACRGAQLSGVRGGAHLGVAMAAGAAACFRWRAELPRRLGESRGSATRLDAALGNDSVLAPAGFGKSSAEEGRRRAHTRKWWPTRWRCSVEKWSERGTLGLQGTARGGAQGRATMVCCGRRRVVTRRAPLGFISSAISDFTAEEPLWQPMPLANIRRQQRWSEKKSCCHLQLLLPFISLHRRRAEVDLPPCLPRLRAEGLAGSGTSQLSTRGFRLEPGQTVQLAASVGWSGRIWACARRATVAGGCSAPASTPRCSRSPWGRALTRTSTTLVAVVPVSRG